MRSICLLIVTSLLAGLFAPQPAEAVLQFYTVYRKEYLDTHPDKDYATAVNKAADKCFVCHQGKNRKHHNAFGIHLVETLDRKKDARDVEKIKAELAKALALPVNPDDPKSETYLDRVKASKWPGGELEELKKEPADEEAAK